MPPIARALLAAALSLALITATPALAAQVTLGLAAGQPQDDSLARAAEIAAVTTSPTLKVIPIAGTGSTADLAEIPNVDAAIVPVAHLTSAQAKAKRVEYAARLYDAEVHVITRRDITDIAALKDKPVAASGAAATLAARTLLGSDATLSPLPPAAAIAAVKSGTVAAAIIAAGAPDPMIAGIHAEDGLHLLALPLADGLVPVSLHADAYPGLIQKGAEIDGLAVPMALAVAHAGAGSHRARRIGQFIAAFFAATGTLAGDSHHVKWREVNIAARIPGARPNPAAQALLKQPVAAPTADDAPAETQPPPALLARFRDWQKRHAQ